MPDCNSPYLYYEIHKFIRTYQHIPYSHQGDEYKDRIVELALPVPEEAE